MISFGFFSWKMMRNFEGLPPFSDYSLRFCMFSAIFFNLLRCSFVVCISANWGFWMNSVPRFLNGALFFSFDCSSVEEVLVLHYDWSFSFRGVDSCAILVYFIVCILNFCMLFFVHIWRLFIGIMFEPFWSRDMRILNLYQYVIVEL